MSALIDQPAARPTIVVDRARSVRRVSPAAALSAARDAMLRSPRSRAAVVVILGVASCAWIFTALLALPRDPMSAAALALSPLLLVALLLAPWTRAAAVVCGGLLVLGGDDSVGTIKIVYGALVILCIALSTVSLLRSRAPWMQQFRILLLPAGALMGVLIVGANFSPVPFSPLAVVRGSIFWLLIAAAPVLGVDAARSLTAAAARRIVGVLGLVVALGFASHWLELRGVSVVGAGHWLLPSVVVPAVGFTVAFVQAASTRGRPRIAWAALAAATVVTMVASGSRTNLLILVAALGTLGAARVARIPVRHALGASLRIAAVVGIAMVALIPVVVANPAFFAGRLRTLTTVFEGDLGTDPSFLMRQDQQATALSIIGAHPFFGYGTGWVLDQVMDTPWVTVVRIGVVGLVMLLAFLVWCGVVIARSAAGGSAARGHAIASGTAVFFLALLVVSSPVDDHGFGFAMILIFTLVAADLRERRRPLHAVRPLSSWGGRRGSAGRASGSAQGAMVDSA